MLLKRIGLAGALAALAAPALATSSAELPPAAAVATFAAQRGGQPLWLRGGVDAPAPRRLVEILRQAPLDGFAAGPKLADAAEAALQQARSGRHTDVVEAERLLSSAWVMYVQTLHWPTAGMIYADPALAPRIPAAAQVLDKLTAAPSLETHVARVAAVNPLYAQLRSAAAGEQDPGKLRMLKANLERARALPGSGRYLLVDLATQRLWMMEDGRPADSMKVVVGKAEMPTPLIAGTIRAATLNPYWNVPQDLVRRTIAPAAMRGGTAYLDAKGYELLSSWSADAKPLPSASVDWAAVADGRTTLRVRQKPGRTNMMGAIKFEFAREQGIYLHDTPNRELFANAVRIGSSGCIRLEDAPRLGRWLLGREPQADGDAPEQSATLPQPVPVYVTYLTAQVNGGGIALLPDVYGLDGGGARQLAAR